MSIDHIVSKQYPCSVQGCRAASQKHTRNSPNPLCWYHDPAHNQDRERAVALGREALQKKRHGETPILIELEASSAKYFRQQKRDYFVLMVLKAGLQNDPRFAPIVKEATPYFLGHGREPLVWLIESLGKDFPEWSRETIWQLFAADIPFPDALKDCPLIDKPQEPIASQPRAQKLLHDPYLSPGMIAVKCEVQK